MLIDTSYGSYSSPIKGQTNDRYTKQTGPAYRGPAAVASIWLIIITTFIVYENTKGGLLETL